MGTNITGIGNANAIGFKSRVTGGIYFPPELKDALVGVWSAYGKSNDSTDRNIIKNKIKDRGGDFVISNAAFKLNSGFGKYEEDFTSWDRIDASTAEISNDGSKIKCINTILNVQYLFNSINKDIPSFKVKISNFTKGNIAYYYRKEDGTEAFLRIEPSPLDKVLELPKSYNTVEGGTGSRGGFYSSNINIGVTITQIPSFEGAFVTDGIDDLITSTKTVQEIGITDEITVVSMIHKISSDNNWTNLIGELKEDHTFVANRATNTDKTGIYGYTYNYVGDAIVINNILGDKNDYIVRTSTSLGLDNKYYVTGFRNAGIIQNISQIAWYWTFIANRVLTEDEINLVIEKYNLDRPGEIVKPQVYYNIKKQKISNDNHSAFDDKLIDYSGNGYDAKLYNFGWKEDSGIGKYETDFTDWKKSFKVTSFDSESIKFTSDVSWVLLYHPSSIGEDIPSFKVRIKLYGKGTLYYNYITQEGKYTNVAVKSEIFETPICYNTKYTGEKGVNVGFTLGVISGECSGTITQIPEYKDALIFDGIDDYGKVAGLPILKDYTVAADYIRTFAKESAQDSPILSKSKVVDSGAFLFNYLNADSITSSYSFGTNNILKEINDSERKIYYLSKYASDGHNVNAGSAVDYDTMWLGTYRDNISNFFTGALYFAMLFPYSLSEFLLERQIKKARAGTLYPNQVEFRPIIPEDENITKIDYFVVNSGTWTIIKPGDYVDVGARIVFNIYTKLPYKVAGVSSTSFTGMSIRPSTGLNIFNVQGYIKDKTPQKIKLTLAVNEDIIQWNPTISANIPDSYDAVTEWFANGWETKIAVGDWIKKSDRIFFKLKLKEPLHEIGKVTFGGSECQATKASNWSESNNLWEIVTYSSVGDLSQVFNVQVDEYIRFEDIVQPYPAFYEFTDENRNLVTWGSKIKVGSTITRIKAFANSNLFKDLYNISYPKLNGVASAGSKYVVERQMVFTCTATYLLDDNEPKCILSPRLLRIPNSSYKILGYIPDISGHGNHGVIHNSAYAEGSGVNEDGSYQFDGVDDFVAIPTLSSGGKQVLMKVNWNTIDSIIYDQRGSGGFAIYCSDYHTEGDSITIPAYKGRNAAGTTYIDGIRNEYVIASQLRNVTHNIVEILDTSYAAGNINPIIGKSTVTTRYGSLALYDFMLFDNVSTDDKIKELNEYVGIEAKVELPPYYWDAYGKTNLDGDKATIQQRGVAVGDFDLTNSNFAYEGMSGYNGYPVVFGVNKTWKQISTENFTWNIDDNKLHITKALIAGNGLLFSYVKLNGSLLNVKEIPSFKIKVSGLEGKSKFGYRYLATEDATKETLVYLGNGTHELAKSFAPTETLLDLTRNVWVGIFITPMVEGEIVFDCDITIEVLPEYENGLVYDGITDYSKNANIPALDDFTAIIKREWLKKQGCPLIKGSKVYEGGNGNALLLEWDKAYNFVFYKRTDIMEGELPDNISFITPTNYNGNVITRGSEQDTNGICIAGDGNAGFANMVFYKLILYPKTIPLLQINFLKNLMEKDEIIDLNNPIFIKDE